MSAQGSQQSEEEDTPIQSLKSTIAASLAA